MNNKEYVRRLGGFLVDNGMTMDVPNLAEHLNWNNLKTGYGTEYSGKRGTYTLIHATYDWLVSIGEQVDADKVAQAFRKPDNTFAYHKN